MYNAFVLSVEVDLRCNPFLFIAFLTYSPGIPSISPILLEDRCLLKYKSVIVVIWSFVNSNFFVTAISLLIIHCISV